MERLIKAARCVTKAREFQIIRRDRDTGEVEYQIFADTERPRNGVQVAWVQSTRHDAEFIALALELAPALVEALLSVLVREEEEQKKG